MKLNPNDRPWAPEDNPRYLLILKKDQPNPQTRKQFVAANVLLLERLQEEAGPEEIALANRILENRLETEVLDWLPPGLFQNPQTPWMLLNLQLVEGSPIHEWKTSVDDLLEGQEMAPEEAQAEAKALTLEGALLRMLED